MIYNTIKKLILTGLFAIILFAPSFVLAQDFAGIDAVGDQIALGGEDPRVIAARVIQIGLGFLGIIAVGLIIYGGWLWMTSQGNEDQVGKAKQVLMSAVIGLIIILSAFAIASFVLNQLLEATGADGGSTTSQRCDPACNAGEYCCGGICQTSPCSIGGNSSSFYIRSTSPRNESDENAINSVVKVTFNKELNSGISDINDSDFEIKKVADIDPETGAETDLASAEEVNGVVSVLSSRKGIVFEPGEACFSGGENKCLTDWSKFEVTINSGSGITSVDNNGLSGLGSTFSFSTGDIVDQGPPKISITPTQICIDDGTLKEDANIIGAWAKDDLGIGYIDLYQKEGQGADVLLENLVGSEKYHKLSHQLDTSGMTLGSEYTFSAFTEDFSGSVASDNFMTTVKPGHCCNGQKDVFGVDDPRNEEDIDCGGTDCSSCLGGACNKKEPNQCGEGGSNCSDSLCSTSFCDCKPEGCVCDLKPVIDYISPVGGFCLSNKNKACFSDEDCPNEDCDAETANGSKGGFITIGGKWFGEFVSGHSKVEFSSNNGASWVSGGAPASVNPDCENLWSDSQIVTVVPSGISEGEVIIKVTAKNDEADSTNDNRGPEIDFIVNNFSRPGICKIDPSSGVMNRDISYYGINLAGSSAYFGSVDKNIQALDALINGEKSGSAKVPNLKTGKTYTFVMRENDKTSSNYLAFVKEKEAYSGPYITSIDPKEGTIGQYVTIRGGGFENIQGGSQVYFGDVNGDEADYEFPEVCADSVWSDDLIIVKVPTGISDGNKKIIIKIVNNIIDSGDILFKVDSTLSLKPSLCKIRPRMGANNIPIDLWGEYFGTQTGKVNFFSNKNQEGSNISLWDKEGEAYHVSTTVHNEAGTGPVKILSSSGQEGNGINFEIGLCTEARNPETACSGQFCCPAGSLEEGRCVDDEELCYSQVKSSVYEWDFSTGQEGSDSDSYDSCQGMSTKLGSCFPYFCPNSPGHCSPYSGGNTEIIGTCDHTCNNIELCETDLCIYNNVIDRCTKGTCGIFKEFIDITGTTTKAYCKKYEEKGRWHIDTKQSCPEYWTRVGPASVCVYLGEECSLCDSGFKCVDDDGDGEGLCATNDDICQQNAVCNNSDQCEQVDKSQCECCCEVGKDAQECCPPLTCAGSCGTGTRVDDQGGSHQLGACSGCRVVINGSVDQDASDAACNCSGRSGQYCDVTADVNGDNQPEGVCRDCASLSYDACLAHDSQCCLDNQGSNKCRGGASFGNEGFCPYFECGTGNNSNQCVGPDKTGDFRDPECNDKCSLNQTGLEQRCYSYEKNPTQCATSNCFFDCLTDAGAQGAYTSSADDCGICCCKPDAAVDKCGEINDYLTCVKDKGKCSGESRGLCCGCSADSNCVVSGSLPTGIGCGNDTCCHERPEVDQTIPDNGAVEVCRNAVIKVVFNQEMNTSSFSGNVIVVGEYAGACPNDAPYLTYGQSSNPGFAKGLVDGMVGVFSRFLPRDDNEALADEPSSDMNYCAIEGDVKNEQITENNTDVTVLSFVPKTVMEANRRYFAIIKGDENLDSSSGVLSSFMIGMNGPSSEILNGVSFNNVYIWSFTTLSDQGNGNKGICEIDSVSLTPSSYLFSTTENDVNEVDDDVNDSSYNTVQDSDKEFVAEALSSDKQILTSTAGYAWTWDWYIGNTTIVKPISVSNQARNRKLIRAENNISNGKTNVIARVNLVDSTYSNIGHGKQATSSVWVFKCENPWPQKKTDGTWTPWNSESEGSCAGICNFEIYYCRDAGGYGSVDDLPALKESATIGASPLVNVMKEYYFFREQAPQSQSTLSGTVDQAGEKVNLSWSEVSGVKGYKLYWGIRSGNYSESVEIDGASVTSYQIDNLINNIDYYFNITSISTGNQESGYYGEIKLTPTDYFGPDMPSITNIIPGDRKAGIEWSDNSDGIAKAFKVFYKAIDANSPFACTDANAANIVFGSGQSVITKPRVLAGLANGVKYCIGLVAYDQDSNASATSTGVITPLAPVNDLSVVAAGDGQVNLDWSKTSGADSYRVYMRVGTGEDPSITYQELSTLDIQDCQVNINKKCATINNLLNNQVYYFKVKSVNKEAVYVDTFSNEVLATPLVQPQLSVLTGNKEVGLSWVAVPGARAYSVYYKYGTENYESKYSVADTSLKFRNLTNGVSYTFKIVPLNEQAQTGTFSNEVIEIPVGTPVISVAKSGTKATISWQLLADAAKYYVYYKTEDGAYQKHGESETASYEIDNLNLGEKYFFKVSAVNSLDHEGYFSNEVNQEY